MIVMALQRGRVRARKWLGCWTFVIFGYPVLSVLPIIRMADFDDTFRVVEGKLSDRPQCPSRRQNVRTATPKTWWGRRFAN